MTVLDLDRPVAGHDEVLDRSRGYVVPELDDDGNVRVCIFDETGSPLGLVCLSLAEFGKVVTVVRRSAEEKYGWEASQGLLP